MIMDILKHLADPTYVAKFQNLCGVETIKPITCDQETQTRRRSSDNSELTPPTPCKEINGNIVTNKTDDHNLAHLYNGIDRSTCNGQQNGGQNLESNKKVTKNIDGSNGCVRHRTSPVSPQSNNKSQSDWPSNGFKSHINGDCSAKDQYEINNFLNGIDTDKYIMQQKSNSTQPKSKSEQSEILPCSEYDSSTCNGQDRGKDRSTLYTPKPSKDFNVKYKSLYYLALFGSFLGNEECYLTFFPFCIWNVDLLIVRQISYLWGMTMYLGQAAKDFLQWPRPPCPPCIRIETHYLQEYSMPSTHAMSGTAIPLYMAYLVVERYQVPVPVAATFAILWFSITCFSRLYLGVHTILDLLVGTVSALMIFFTFLRYVEVSDLFLQTHPLAAPILLLTSIALCTVCYPKNFKNSSKGDTVQIVSAVAGCNIGAWLGYQLGLMHEPEIGSPFLIAIPSLYWLFIAVLRFASGLVLVALVYAVARWLSLRFWFYVYGVTDKEQIITAYKFTTYGVVGFAISLLVPLMHVQLGIPREALFFEVV